MCKEHPVADATFNAATQIKATDLRTHTRNILERAKFHGERFVVHTYRQPMAVLIGFEEYLRLVEQANETD
jgi:antitoxin (DNA-binding transcriptional repressor) of toxin-antitoxin stability system